MDVIAHAHNNSRTVNICQAAFVNSVPAIVAAMFTPVLMHERLKAALAASGKSQASVSRETGIAPPRLNNYLTGLRHPDARTLERIAAVLGTDADTLSGANQNLTTSLEVVLTMLLGVNGLSEQRATVIAQSAVEALRVLKALPDEGDPVVRARLAAQAAWQSRTAREQ
jgi:transcriptional regulator with XRE-family HTH domain